VIRRGFWLTTGAVTGIVAYRRVSAVGRRVSASLNQGTGLNRGTGRPLISVRQTRRAAIRAARETYRFSRDVREGMELYMARHSAPAGSTLRTDKSLETARHDDEKDGH
jgi:hypothetical protein